MDLERNSPDAQILFRWIAVIPSKDIHRHQLYEKSMLNALNSDVFVPAFNLALHSMLWGRCTSWISARHYWISVLYGCSKKQPIVRGKLAKFYASCSNRHAYQVSLIDRMVGASPSRSLQVGFRSRRWGGPSLVPSRDDWIPKRQLRPWVSSQGSRMPKSVAFRGYRPLPSAGSGMKSMVSPPLCRCSSFLIIIIIVGFLHRPAAVEGIEGI